MKRVVCLLMVCGMLLSGCGAKKELRKTGLFYEACGVSPDAVLLRVDGREVPAVRYLYWLTYGCDYLADRYAGTDSGPDWSDPATVQSVQQQALETTVLYAVIENWAEQYGCVVTEEDRADMEREWTALCGRCGGEDACLNSLAWMGLERADADEFSRDYYLYSRLYQLYRTEGSALSPAQTELEDYAAAQRLVTVDMIFVSTAGADTEAALAERRERADVALSKLEGSSDPASYFSTLALACSDQQNREEHPEGVTVGEGDGSVPAAVLEAARSLEENRWSGVLTAEGGYYIALRRPLRVEDVAALHFDSLLQKAAAKAAVEYEKAWSRIDTAEFYQKVMERRNSLQGGEVAGAFSASTWRA